MNPGGAVVRRVPKFFSFSATSPPSSTAFGFPIKPDKAPPASSQIYALFSSFKLLDTIFKRIRIPFRMYRFSHVTKDHFACWKHSSVEEDNGGRGVVPVSYTHLDVYKRQPYGG